jgi:hypothetical protein
LLPKIIVHGFVDVMNCLVKSIDNAKIHKIPLNDKWQTAVLQLAICILRRVGLACCFENHGGYLGAADAEQEDA